MVLFDCFSNKMLSTTKYRSENVITEPDLSRPMAVTMKSAKQKTSSEMLINCDNDGCKKTFKDFEAYNIHMLAEHPSSSSNQIEQLSS